MDRLLTKREQEKRSMEKMVRLYCRGNRHKAGADSLCPGCAALLAYANQRTDGCPRMEEKTFCSRCPHPCYAPAMREKVRAVMRYAGPRMLLYNPLLALRHLMATRKGSKQTGNRRRAG